MTTEDPSPIGPHEISRLLGVNRQRVLQLMAAYPDFPAPWEELATGRIWRDTDVAAWALGKKRKVHPWRPEAVDASTPGRS